MSRTLNGTVTSIGDEGNLITDIAVEQLDGVPRDEQVTVTCDEHSTIGIYTRDHGQPAMTLLALVGDSGRLELTLVGERASDFLDICVGAPVAVKW